jgi:hypothetical protein
MKDISDLQKLAREFDNKFRLPMGIRIGWDGLLGFVPGVGDFVTNSVSYYIVIRAALIGCPPILILRMGLNILVDNLIDAIPILGNFLDFGWKSNSKNVALVEAFLVQPGLTARQSKIRVGISLFTALSLLLLGLGLTIYIAYRFINWLMLL